MVVIVILWVVKPTKTTRWFRSMNNFWLVYDQIHFKGLWMIMDFIP